MYSQRESGQAMIFVTILLAMLVLTLAYVFNSGQISNERTRLQNTTDAVAYSVATVEAKDLNFKAYTNRAMVANQVAVAHSVGIISWTRWLRVTGENLNTIGQFFPYVNAITALIRSVGVNIEQGAATVIPPLARLTDIVIGALSASQQVMHLATLELARQALIQVARENDPSVNTAVTLTNSYFFAQIANQHQGFTRRYSPTSTTTADRQRTGEFRQVTLDSRDGFLNGEKKRYDLFETPSIPPLRVKIVRRGGTELRSRSGSPNFSWTAIDTLSAHYSEYDCDLSGCDWSRYREAFPIGWGGAQSATPAQRIALNRYRRTNYYDNTWRVNRSAATMAHRRFNSANMVDQSYGGLRNFYDITQGGLVKNGPGLIVYLTKPQGTGAVRTVRETGFNTANSQIDLEQRGGMNQRRLGAAAKAIPSFSRGNDIDGSQNGSPVLNRGNNSREYGNLYNPFWHPKLVPLSEAEKRQIQLISTVP